MNKLFPLVLCLALATLLRARAAEPDKPKGAPVAKDSAWTWGYFFAPADKAGVKALVGDRKNALAVYKVDKVVPIRGEPGVKLSAGVTFVRLEVATRMPERDGGQPPALLFRGVPQHLEYMSKAQREELKSRPEFPASKDTIAVVIPIRKSAAWWALAHDERMAYFQKTADHKGHTALGTPYVDRIHRKLYHTRYAVETTGHDFITYFEFQREHEADFKRLLAALRDVKQNPEWNFVDREYEIWMTKLE
ncbi:hypothetical protein AYO44_08240 [Planctomycetaceae bacterium SCGC AG-212-F19]|nr:hypothetical protein AYO44_08240 [Planctomycetaceae bacterium SCGC AG-212-F19]